MTVPKLANAERAVMERLWQTGSLTARLLREHLYPDAANSMHGTIQRLLQRLENKGFVHRDRDRAAHLFTALISREAYAAGRPCPTAGPPRALAGVACLHRLLVESDGVVGEATGASGGGDLLRHTCRECLRLRTP